MVLGLYIFLADGASHQATVMVIQACSGNNAMTSLAFGQGRTEGFLLAAGILVSGKTGVAFKEAVAVLMIFPFDDRTVLHMA